jgi:hypothetical protein
LLDRTQPRTNTDYVVLTRRLNDSRESAMPTRTLPIAAAAALAAAVFAAGPAAAQHPSELTRRDKAELFIQHLVKVLRIDPAKYQALVLEYEIGTALSESSQEIAKELAGADFIQNAIAELYPAYARALEAFAAGKDDEAVAALGDLDPSALGASGGGGKPNPYVVAYAELLRAEIELRAGKYADAIARCEKLSRDERQRLIADHRACELIALAFEKEGRGLLEFAQYALLLTDYDELPPEVKARAEKRTGELQEEYGRPLHTVAGWMRRVESLLCEEVTAADPTQKEEREIVSALDKLIELQEALERRTCSGCGGNCRGACRSGTPKGNKSQTPAQVSKLPPRGEGIVHLGGVSRGSSDSIWGLLGEKDASRALKSFGDKLPPRYAELLKKYYKALAKEE